MLSGLQLEVLALYRSLIREAARKDAARMAGSNSSSYYFVTSLQTYGTSLNYARTEFRRKAKELRRSDFQVIEYRIRKTRKQIKCLQMPSVTTIGDS
jgi:Complex 1 protein (LYR family)